MGSFKWKRRIYYVKQCSWSAW